MIAKFPNYTPISLDAQAEIKQIAGNYPPYADFNFVNLMSWNNGGQGAVSLLHNNLVVFYPSYVGEGHFLTFLGNNQVVDTARTLLDVAEADPRIEGRKLQLVPAIGAAALAGHEQIQTIEDPDNHDYVISLPKLVTMEGASLRRFRRAIHVFERQNGDQTRLTRLDLTDREVQSQILDIFTSWEAHKQTDESINELGALRRLLQDANHCQLLSYGLEVEDQLEAFIIVEAVKGGWSIGHFWKADIGYRGIYSYFMYRVADVLTQKGITLMNIQADLGIEGLRLFKATFDPVGSLKKYTVQDAPRSN